MHTNTRYVKCSERQPRIELERKCQFCDPNAVPFHYSINHILKRPIAIQFCVSTFRLIIRFVWSLFSMSGLFSIASLTLGRLLFFFSLFFMVNLTKAYTYDRVVRVRVSQFLTKRPGLALHAHAFTNLFEFENLVHVRW